MKFNPAYISARLIKRYKRFLADVKLSDGRIITVHTPNTGSMLGLSDPGMRIWLRDTQNPGRKYQFSWEISEPEEGVLVGVHTGIVNQLVTEAIEQNRVPELTGYDHIRQERPYGKENSRIDLLLSARQRPDCYIEIKNVTAVDEKKSAIFPDAVTSRGQKHLRELIELAGQGLRAVMFFCIQRTDCHAFRPATEIDSRYSQLLAEAHRVGVEILAYQASVTPNRIEITDPVEILFDQFTGRS